MRITIICLTCLAAIVLSTEGANSIQATITDTSTAAVTSIQGMRGDTDKSISIELTNEIGIVGVQFDLFYDSTAFEVTDVALTGRSQNFSLFFWGIMTPGMLRVILADIALFAILPGSGPIIDIDLHVFNTALPGTYPLMLDDVRLSDSLFTLQPVDLVDGTFTVQVILDSLRIEPRTAELACAEIQQFAATGYDLLGPPMPLSVDWSLWPMTLGQIDSTGLFTADQHGSGWVKATFQTWSDSIPVDVGPAEPMALDIEPDSAQVLSGAQQQYTATGTDACNNHFAAEVTWTVQPQNLGFIDTDGLFTGTVAGSGWIIASTNPTDSTFVTVLAGPLADIEISPASEATTCADTIRFSATGYDANHNSISVTPDWVVMPETLGVIDTQGLFTAAKSGGGWIVASYEAFFDSAFIAVEAGSLAILDIEPDSIIIESGQSQQLSVAGFDACGNSLTVLPTWSFSSPHLGTITTEGLFTAQAEGEGWIYVTGSAIDSAYVLVQHGPATTLTLFPADTTVSSGATVTYTAMAADAYNTWDVSNLTAFITTDPTGSISGNLYTSRSTGTWSIIGTYAYDSTTLSDTASVTVTLQGLCTRGDVNCDEAITPGDALCAFWRSILGSFQEECVCLCSEESAEINCDGAITPGDALCIFWRSILGEWPEDCVCQPPAKNHLGGDHAKGLQIASLIGKPQDAIRVPIYLDSPQGFDAFGLELTYPAMLLEYVDISPSAMTRDWAILDGTSIEPGLIRVGGFHTEGLSADGLTPIAEIIFSVREGAEGAGEFELFNCTDDLAGVPIAKGNFLVAIDPTDFALHANYPNPFNPTTHIHYTIPVESERLKVKGKSSFNLEPSTLNITLKVFNILGQEVRTLVDEIQQAGYYSVAWDGRDNTGSELPSGIYFYRLTAGNLTATRQMILMK